MRDRLIEVVQRLENFDDRLQFYNQAERDAVLVALKEYIEQHKPYVPPPPPPTLEAQFADMVAWMSRNLPGASATIVAGEFENDGHKWVDHLITITDWPLPSGYDRPTCTVYFVVPSAYQHNVPPDRFFTDDLTLESGAQPHYTRHLVTTPFEAHGYTWSPETIGPRFKAPEGTMIWFWKVQSWDSRRDTLRTYAGVIKSRLDRANAGVPRVDWDD